jgi:hypothetical protein
MKISLISALLMLAPATACFAQTAARQACSVEVDVTDTDPKGTNVRSSPGGSVVTALKNPTENGWIVVHLSAQLGDWYEIDRASLIDNDVPPGGKILFQGKGYLHKSVVGVSGMQNGGIVYRTMTSGRPHRSACGRRPAGRAVGLLGRLPEGSCQEGRWLDQAGLHQHEHDLHLRCSG